MLEIITGKAKELLSKKRFYHSLCVMETAAELAQLYGEDTEKAKTAGISHDIYREKPKDNQLKYLLSHDILVDDLFRASPSVWHGFCAGIYIAGEFGINDRDIINAVKYHTTARAGMSPLEKIIYTADAISADRSYPDVEYYRSLAGTDLNRAFFEILQYSIKKLTGDKKILLPDTINAYNHYLQEQKGAI